MRRAPRSPPPLRWFLWPPLAWRAVPGRYRTGRAAPRSLLANCPPKTRAAGLAGRLTFPLVACCRDTFLEEAGTATP